MNNLFKNKNKAIIEYEVFEGETCIKVTEYDYKIKRKIRGSATNKVKSRELEDNLFSYRTRVINKDNTISVLIGGNLDYLVLTPINGTQYWSSTGVLVESPKHGNIMKLEADYETDIDTFLKVVIELLKLEEISNFTKPEAKNFNYKTKMFYPQGIDTLISMYNRAEAVYDDEKTDMLHRLEIVRDLAKGYNNLYTPLDRPDGYRDIVEIESVHKLNKYEIVGKSYDYIKVAGKQNETRLHLTTKQGVLVANRKLEDNGVIQWSFLHITENNLKYEILIVVNLNTSDNLDLVELDILNHVLEPFNIQI